MLQPDAFELILYVRDLDAARGFYADLLGFPVIYESDWFLSFDAGGLFLSCNGRRKDYEANGTGGRGVLVEFRVPDVDRAYESLNSLGIPFDFAPEEKPWGLRSCATRDPEGYQVWLSTPTGQGRD